MDVVLLWLALAALLIVFSFGCFLYELAGPLNRLAHHVLSPLLCLPKTTPARFCLRILLHLAVLPAAVGLLLAASARGHLGPALLLAQAAWDWQLRVLLPAWLLLRLLRLTPGPPRWPSLPLNALALAVPLLFLTAGAARPLAEMLGEELRLAGWWMLLCALLMAGWELLRGKAWSAPACRHMARAAGMGALAALAGFALLSAPLLLARIGLPALRSQDELIALRPFSQQVRLDPLRALREARRKADHFQRHGQPERSRQALDEALAWLDARPAPLPWAWTTERVQLRMDRAWRLREVERNYAAALDDYRQALAEDTLLRPELWGEYALTAALAGDASAVAEAMPHWREGRDYVGRDPGYWYDAASILLALRTDGGDSCSEAIRSWVADHGARAAAGMDSYLGKHGYQPKRHEFSHLALHEVVQASELRDGVEAVTELWRNVRRDFRHDGLLRGCVETLDVKSAAAPLPARVLVRNALIAAMSQWNIATLESYNAPLPGWAGSWLRRGVPGFTNRTRDGVFQLQRPDGTARKAGDHTLLVSRFVADAGPIALYVWHERDLAVILDGKTLLERRNTEDFYRNVAQVELPPAPGERTLMLRTDSPRILVYTDPPVEWTPEGAP